MRELLTFFAAITATKMSNSVKDRLTDENRAVRGILSSWKVSAELLIPEIKFSNFKLLNKLYMHAYYN